MSEACSNDTAPVNSARIMTDRETGRSRGFAFVEMENESEADQAISALNGYTMDGRALNVNEARPKPERGFGAGGGGGRGFGGGGGGGRPGGGGGGGGRRPRRRWWWRRRQPARTRAGKSTLWRCGRAFG